MFIILLNLVGISKAQDIDNFDVGPYEVDYKGKGDFKFRLRKDIDLYKYFNLEKDTTIQYIQTTQPLKNAIQLNVLYSLPIFTQKGNSNLLNISGTWKQKLYKFIYLDTGLSFGVSYGKYNSSLNFLKEIMLEASVPIAVEFTKLDKKISSLYLGIGVIPTYYRTVRAQRIINNETIDANINSGFLIAPKIDFGGYIPLYKHLIRIGIYGQYNFNLSKRYGDIFKERNEQAFFGTNIGLIF